jgi:hypothetical protein
MAIATLRISEQVFMEIEISDTPVPPTPNFIDEVFIRDGFGQAAPTLELLLYDQKGTLVQDLALMEGKAIKITMSRNTGKTLVRKFLVFAFSSISSHTGPRLRVVCILDCPMFIAKAMSKAYTGTSDSVMRQLAGEAGLQYDGHTTSDQMKWLRVCSTLSSFSEDIALHGYANANSCMTRILTADHVLRYKDLFHQLTQAAKATILHNAGDTGVEGKALLAREIRSGCQGGIMSYWMNYGYAQYEHDLSGVPTEQLQASAPLSGGPPINQRVKGEIERSRTDYLGLDTGMAPKDGPNVHQYYRTAKYQNFRFMGLFSEAITALVEDYSELQPLDCVVLEYNDLQNNEFISNSRFADRYIVGNRVMAIKNGSRYYETLKLYRANVGTAKS